MDLLLTFNRTSMTSSKIHQLTVGLLFLSGLLFGNSSAAAGTLRVGISPWYFPLVFVSEDGKPAGIDADVAMNIAKRLALTLEYVVLPREKLGAAVAAGEIDFGIGAIEERSYLRGDAGAHVDPTKVLLVEYFNVPMVFVMRLPEVKTVAQLSSRNLATLSYFAARVTLADWQTKGFVGKIFGLESQTVLVNTLKLKRVDGIMVALPTGLELAATSGGIWHVIENHDPGKIIREPLAAILPTTKSTRNSTIAAAIEEFRQSNEIVDIAKRWIDN